MFAPPGTTVGLAEAPSTCRDILDGRHDDVPVDALFFSADIAEIRTDVGQDLTSGPVTLAQSDPA